MKRKLLSILALLCLTVSSAAETTVTFTPNDLTNGAVWDGAKNNVTKDGVTLTAEQCDGYMIYGSGSFTTTLGNFTRIEITAGSVDISGDGWSGNTWTGNAESVSANFNIEDWSGITIVCTIETGSAQEETLLTTIVNTGDNDSFNSGSKTFDNIATVTFSGNVINSGDDYYGWYSDEERTLTVTAAEGYTITRVKFYNFSGSAFDAEAPFEAILVKSGYDNITIVNGTSLEYNGVTKIEVYGYASTPEPAAPTVVASGNCGTSGHESDVTWSLTDDGTLTISGSGAMADYASAGAQPWKSSRTSITSIVVGEGVTHIGNSAFRGCSNATSISLPTSLTSIGNSAFNGCTNEALTSITIPENVESIGQQAFMNCPGLTSVTIGNSVTSIGNGAFTSCNNEGFTTVTIPDKVESIGNNAFLACTGLMTVTLGSGVTSIGSSAFANCSNLTTVTLNSNPTIDTYAFPATTAVTMNLTANAAGGANWMTFYNQNYDFEADANTQVFKAALTDTELTLTKLEMDQTVTKSNAVILKSTASPIVMTLTSTASSNDFSGNSLQGVSAAAGLTAADPSTTFVLNNGTGGVGFYRLKSGKTLGVGKAYLTYSGASAPEFFGFGETTGVNEVRGQMEDVRGEYYDLQGRRVVNPTKGLYIVNGKKVVIK